MHFNKRKGKLSINNELFEFSPTAFKSLRRLPEETAFHRKHASNVEKSHSCILPKQGIFFFKNVIFLKTCATFQQKNGVNGKNCFDTTQYVVLNIKHFVSPLHYFYPSLNSMGQVTLELQIGCNRAMRMAKLGS